MHIADAFELSVSFFKFKNTGISDHYLSYEMKCLNLFEQVELFSDPRKISIQGFFIEVYYVTNLYSYQFDNSLLCP